MRDRVPPELIRRTAEHVRPAQCDGKVRARQQKDDMMERKRHPATASRRVSTEPMRIELLGVVDYDQAWDLQRQAAEARRNDDGPDVLILLEHPSVYTAGRLTKPEDRPTDGTPVVEVDRGGRITWHGPGQLVGYPVVALTLPLDVADYMRRIEQGLIEVVTDLGLPACRVPGRTGVWLPADQTRRERKLAAAGVRIQRGVTTHGFSLNCDVDLSAYQRIVPCGIADADVTSLTAELGKRIATEDVLDAVAAAIPAALDGVTLVTDGIDDGAGTVAKDQL
jgi:lipoyl(octanoyl) transferase